MTNDAEDWELTAEEMDRLVDGAVEQKARENALFRSLKNRRIFYYPACAYDWNPIWRFSHLCDTFIYVDYSWPEADFEKSLRDRPRNVPAAGGLEVVEITGLFSDCVEELARAHGWQDRDFPAVNEPWGKAVDLVRRVGNDERKIKLLYFHAEGATVYRNLFTKRSIAPRMVCLKRCLHGFGGENWTTFLRWDGPLGRAVWDNPVRPEFLVAADRNEGWRCDWPWDQPWQQHRDWESGYGLEVLNSYVLPSALRPSAGAPVRRGGPGFDRTNHLVSREGRTLVRIKRPPFDASSIPAQERQFSLSRADGQSLELVLHRLRESCAAEGVEDAHAVGCHFEDEAPALHDWKWGGSHPKTLTIYCESEGDLACYGPAADEVID